MDGEPRYQLAAFWKFQPALLALGVLTAMIALPVPLAVTLRPLASFVHVVLVVLRVLTPSQRWNLLVLEHGPIVCLLPSDYLA